MIWFFMGDPLPEVCEATLRRSWPQARPARLICCLALEVPLKLKALKKHLDSLPGSEPSFPFGPEVRVSKVGGKMFALVVGEAKPLRINLKCDPEFAIALREGNSSIQPGYHMNKRHWNTVVLDGGVEKDELIELIWHSYALIVKKLTRKKRNELIALGLDPEKLTA